MNEKQRTIYEMSENEFNKMFYYFTQYTQAVNAEMRKHNYNGLRYYLKKHNLTVNDLFAFESDCLS